MSGGYGFTVNGEPVGDEAVPLVTEWSLNGYNRSQNGNVSRETVGRVSFSPCRTAHDLVHGDRQDAYGHPGPLYTKVGRAWAAILDVPEIDAETVLVMMAVLKAVRFSHRGGEDSLTDLAGYAEAIALVRGK